METKDKIAGIGAATAFIVFLFGTGLFKDYINRKPADSVTFSLQEGPRIARASDGRIGQIIISVSITYSSHGTASSKIERPMILMNDALFANDCQLHDDHSNIIVPETQDDSEFMRNGVLKGESMESSKYDFYIYDSDKNRPIPKTSIACLFVQGEDSKLNNRNVTIPLGSITISPDLPLKLDYNSILKEWKIHSYDVPYKLF